MDDLGEEIDEQLEEMVDTDSPSVDLDLFLLMLLTIASPPAIAWAVIVLEAGLSSSELFILPILLLDSLICKFWLEILESLGNFESFVDKFFESSL